ncbi:transcriptional regulator, MarR family [Bifidobacterium gallicum DSM 20093 = LMG 11596]|nr:transcriptional regulator, MarR family [Bifidobacterium gallicum DSM 20093 = LMG 11596]
MEESNNNAACPARAWFEQDRDGEHNQFAYADEAMHTIMVTVLGNRSKMARTIERGAHGEMFVLRDLLFNGARTPTQLCAAMGVTSGRVSTVLSSLLKKGWVRRQEDAADRRRVVITLTDQGKDVVREHYMQLRDDLRWAFQQMGERRTREFAELFHEFFTLMSLITPGQARPSAQQVREAFEHESGRQHPTM